MLGSLGGFIYSHGAWWSTRSGCLDGVTAMLDACLSSKRGCLCEFIDVLGAWRSTRLGPNKDIIYSELALTGYLMFRKERRESMGYSVILYIKEYIQADEITLKNEADCEEAIWCNIVTKNSTVTI